MDTKTNPVPFFQLWRGYVARETTWGQRLDPVTTWAVMVVISFSASVLYAERCGHECFLILPFLLLPFSCMEAQRYMVYSITNKRAELVQRGYFNPLLLPPTHISEAKSEAGASFEIDVSWQQQFVDSFGSATPNRPISFFQAWCVRYQRTYSYLCFAAMMLWYLKLYITAAIPIAAMITIPLIFIIMSVIIIYMSRSNMYDV